MTLSPFHLAFPVHDLAAARAFWGGVMGCPEGRSSAEWVDFDFYGHQIVTHLVPGCDQRDEASNPVTDTACRCRISESCCRWTNGRRSQTGSPLPEPSSP